MLMCVHVPQVIMEQIVEILHVKESIVSMEDQFQINCRFQLVITAYVCCFS